MRIIGKGYRLNDDKFKNYLDDDYITDLGTLEEALFYYNTYDYQEFETVDDMIEYIEPYGFLYLDHWYHINYDEALDVIEKEGD